MNSRNIGTLPSAMQQTASPQITDQIHHSAFSIKHVTSKLPHALTQSTAPPKSKWCRLYDRNWLHFSDRSHVARIFARHHEFDAPGLRISCLQTIRKKQKPLLFRRLQSSATLPCGTSHHRLTRSHRRRRVGVQPTSSNVAGCRLPNRSPSTPRRWKPRLTANTTAPQQIFS